MKNRFLRNVMVLAMTGALALSVTACGSSDGETKEGKKQEAVLNGYYSSTQNVDFLSAFPEYTFKQATFGLQTIETYGDGTYCLTTTDSSFSGSLTFSDDGNHEEVPRGASSMKFYGTYTSEEEQGLMTLTLSAPKSVVTASTYSVGEDILGYLNTDAWTEEMGSRAGGEEGAMTAEEYLKSVSYDEISVIVDAATNTFDYTKTSQAE